MRGRRLWTCVLVAGALAGCAARRRPEPGAGEHTYDNPALGVSFTVPDDWLDDREGDAVVVGGRPGTQAFFTTLTL